MLDIDYLRRALADPADQEALLSILHFLAFLAPENAHGSIVFLSDQTEVLLPAALARAICGGVGK